MNNDRIRKAFVIAVALSGVVLNGYYGIELVRAFLDPQTSPGIRQILVSAIVLEFGWMALLLWMILKPFERRQILLLTMATILGGNILVGVSQLMENPGNLAPVIGNSVFGLVFSALYLAAYWIAKPAASSTS